MMKTYMKDSLGAALAVVVLAASASAGIIVDPPAPIVSGPGLGFAAVPAVVTINPNNDNQDGTTPLVDNNVLVPIKRFDSNQYIDIVFTVQDSGVVGQASVTEYRVQEFVDNNTGIPWTDYTMQLGFGTGAGFTLSTPGDGLDFDAGPPGGFDPPPTSAAFSTILAPNEDTLVFTGGLQGSGAQPFSLRIDVPDLNGRLPIVSTFTLRQFPTPIPEPTTLAIAGLMACCGLAVSRRGR